MLVIPPGYGQVSYRWTVEGDPEEMISTCGVNLAGVAGDFQGACDLMRDEWQAQFPAAAFFNTYRWRGTRLRVGQDGAPPLVFESQANVLGTSTDKALPNNCAILVKKLTASAGRRNRGRFFLPPAFANEATIGQTGIIDSAAVTALNVKFAALLASMIGGTAPYTPVILHSVAEGAPAMTPTVITQFIVDDRVATQRKRLRR